MLVIQSNSNFDTPRDQLSKYFSRGDLYFPRDIHLCFVCGAAGEKLPETGNESLRHMFITYAENVYAKEITCVRAETAATELLRQIDERGQNISAFEKTIAGTVDSILVFPESPGSFAELGLFSAHEDISRKTLVAIYAEHQTNSFINFGPIHAISRVSLFSPIPIALTKTPSNEMDQIARRLLGESLQKRAYRNRFQKQPWKDYTSREQLSLIDEIINITGSITEKDLINIIQCQFGKYDISQIRLQLSLLVATRRIHRDDNGDIYAKPRNSPFFLQEDGQETLKLKGVWRQAWEKYNPETLRELERTQDE